MSTTAIHTLSCTIGLTRLALTALTGLTMYDRPLRLVLLFPTLFPQPHKAVYGGCSPCGVAVHSCIWLLHGFHAPSWLRIRESFPPNPANYLHRSFYQPYRCTPTRGHHAICSRDDPSAITIRRNCQASCSGLCHPCAIGAARSITQHLGGRRSAVRALGGIHRGRPRWPSFRYIS